MNPRKIIFSFLILFAAFQIYYPQDTPKAELFDEVSKIPCDAFWARADMFFEELRKEPLSTGYVIIYGKKKEWLTNLASEYRLRGIINFRKFDEKRIKFVRSFESEEFKIQFWKSINNTEKPEITTKIWDFKILDLNKAVNLQRYTLDEICPGAMDGNGFREILKANPNLRGNLVVNAKSRKKFYEKKKELAEFLSPIDRSRLKFFYVNSEYDYVEYWLVPKKKSV